MVLPLIAAIIAIAGTSFLAMSALRSPKDESKPLIGPGEMGTTPDLTETFKYMTGGVGGLALMLGGLVVLYLIMSRR